jgi:hypothetical protein
VTVDRDYTIIVANPHAETTGGKPIAVYGIGRYEDWSVLAGQTKRVFLDDFDTVEEAQVAYPDASESGLPERARVPINPPSWFDPMDAGERWSEDD